MQLIRDHQSRRKFAVVLLAAENTWTVLKKKGEKSGTKNVISTSFIQVKKQIKSYVTLLGCYTVLQTTKEW